MQALLEAEAKLPEGFTHVSPLAASHLPSEGRMNRVLLAVLVVAVHALRSLIALPAPPKPVLVACASALAASPALALAADGGGDGGGGGAAVAYAWFGISVVAGVKGVADKIKGRE